MPSYKELERRIKQSNAEICDRCYRDNCEGCEDLIDVDDAWDTLGDEEFHRQRDEGRI